MNFGQQNYYSVDTIIRSLIQAERATSSVDSKPRKRRKSVRAIPPEPAVRKSDDLLGKDTVLAIANRVFANRIPLLSKTASNKAGQAEDKTPSREELKRVYDILKADSELSNRIAGLGFGRNGDGLRRAYARIRATSLVALLRDGKGVRNRIVHTPGYIPSDEDARRTLRQYDDANADILRILSKA